MRSYQRGQLENLFGEQKEVSSSFDNEQKHCGCAKNDFFAEEELTLKDYICRAGRKWTFEARLCFV
jgi:hypothetical protein